MRTWSESADPEQQVEALFASLPGTDDAQQPLMFSMSLCIVDPLPSARPSTDCGGSAQVADSQAGPSSLSMMIAPSRGPDLVY
jgi:hypothetical protein